MPASPHIPSLGTPTQGVLAGTGTTRSIVVNANDLPYGRLGLESATLVTSEPEGAVAALSLRLIRSHSTLGSVEVTVIVEEDSSAPMEHRATVNR